MTGGRRAACWHFRVAAQMNRGLTEGAPISELRHRRRDGLDYRITSGIRLITHQTNTYVDREPEAGVSNARLDTDLHYLRTPVLVSRADLRPARLCISRVAEGRTRPHRRRETAFDDTPEQPVHPTQNAACVGPTSRRAGSRVFRTHDLSAASAVQRCKIGRALECTHRHGDFPLQRCATSTSMLEWLRSLISYLYFRRGTSNE